MVYNWTGFYIGGNIGGAFAGSNGLEGDGGRFFGGVQGGFDYQFAGNWVLGAEAQYSWLANSNNGVLLPGGALVTSNNDQLGSVTGRLGYAWGPALLYGKGGFAWRDNTNIGVFNVGRCAGGFATTGNQKRRLHRRRRSRIHVCTELVRQARIPVLQCRQPDLGRRTRRVKSSGARFRDERAYLRQAWPELPVWLGRAGAKYCRAQRSYRGKFIQSGIGQAGLAPAFFTL